ncbi:hypothetical protein Cgig2_030509 [Carnegiea gigantea]|uniref:Uncharacterized protein n=1 Tax=Carnegiea gigantea TaxID=171969 RepID=A0A9Q1GKL3_9CARY|nr:hypothetical protein Cgig2_030509 [Carnegiea gigantea]
MVQVSGMGNGRIWPMSNGKEENAPLDRANFEVGSSSYSPCMMSTHHAVSNAWEAGEPKGSMEGRQRFVNVQLDDGKKIDMYTFKGLMKGSDMDYYLKDMVKGEGHRNASLYMSNQYVLVLAVKMENEAQSESVGTPRSPTPASGHCLCPLSQIGSSFAAHDARPPRPPAAFSEDDAEHVAKINPSDMAEIKGKRRSSWV